MRLSPVKSLCLFSMFLPISILGVPSPATALAESEEKVSQMEQIVEDLQREKEQYKIFDLKEKGLLEQLSSLEKHIMERRIILKELEEEIQLRKAEYRERQGHLKELDDALTQMEGLLAKRLVAFYKNARRGYIKILVTTGGLDQLNHRIKYLRVILNEDRRIMKETAEKRENYRKEVFLLEEKLAAIAELEKEERLRVSELKEDVEEKVVLLAKIHREKEFYEIAVRELEAAARDLKETLLSLESDEQKTQVLPTGFVKAKGKLSLPLKGEIVKDSGKSGEKDFGTLKGIYIRGNFGSDVKAVFPGRVDFSGQLKGYGQVIVINHGSRFYTISAYLLKRNKLEGEMVAESEVIGQVGETGMLTGPALYFEIRVGDTNLEPLEWLKVD
jgi:septal ring factor EnvC (AmiA/AmiB activator)